MNTNLPTNDMNIEDYEDQAIKKTKLAKGVGIAAAGAVGGAAIAAGTTYAATLGGDDPIDVPLTADEMAMGAEIGEGIEPVAEEPEKPSAQYIYIEKPAPTPQHEEESEPEVIWEETTNYYIDGEKVASIEEGKIDGHDVMIVDSNADGHADILAYDVNNNHIYEENEIVQLTPLDNIHMGNPTAHVSDIHHDPYFFPEDVIEQPYAYNEHEPHQIHNNFEDEKTGEEYSGDFAENNPDYNPHANLDYGSNEQYLAENYGYDGGDQNNYHASLNEMEEDNVASQPDLAEASDSYDDSFDSMMDSEEFLG